MIRLLFASQNRHKAEEIRAILPVRFEIVSLAELNYFQELPETGATLEENALQKCRRVHSLFQMDCFAEDTGLEIRALNGLPGVQSARFAGEGKSASENVMKLLDAMREQPDRKAVFRTVIALNFRGKEYRVSGECIGAITREIRGSGGFGYDPVFMPEGFDNTFAQMEPELKNRISHRHMAIDRMTALIHSLAVE